MKKIVLFMAAAAICGGMASCQKEDNCPVEVKNVKANAAVPLTIQATIGDQTRAFSEKKTPWQAGDKLGLFVLNKGDENAFPGTTLNLPYTYGATGWTNPTTISISDKLPRVCAYYPYSSSNSNLKAVPFDMQSDFLYSTPVVPIISASNADVRMNMKHVLTQFLFKVQKDASYKAEGKITKLTIKGSGTELHKSGTINLLDGKITGVPADNNEYSYSVQPSGELSAAVMPVKGNLNVKILVDGRTYTCTITADWRSGMKYIYPLTLSATKLTVGNGDDGNGKGSQITIEPWSNAQQSGLTLNPVKN